MQISQQNTQQSSKRQLQQPRNRSSTPSANKQQSSIKLTSPTQQHPSVQQQNRQRSTPPVSGQPQHNMLPSPTQNQQVQHQMQQQHHPMHHQVAVHQSYAHHPQLGASPMHQVPHHPHHSVLNSGNYIQVTVSSQGFPTQATSTYVSVPMTVIQHRMSAQQNLGNHQKLAPSPSCAVTTGTNFYIQANAHPHVHTPTPTPTPIPSASLQGNSGQANSSCSLAKLQQLTNGLDMMPPSSCSTMTPPPTAMTLSPTPSPTHQMIPNQPVRNLAPSPSAIQPQVLGYHKYYQTNMNVNQLSGAVTPPIGQNLGRSRNPSNVSVQHMQTTASRVSPNVAALNPNMMYNSLNGYRMTTQQTPGPVTGYIPNTAGFINNAQIPMQMGVMNMTQTQYQDPAAIQRAAQQNTMYTYGYGLMQPLNSTMRR